MIAGFLPHDPNLEFKKGFGGFDWVKMGRVIILAEVSGSSVSRDCYFFTDLFRSDCA
jgi:hypothetical protein